MKNVGWGRVCKYLDGHQQTGDGEGEEVEKSDHGELMVMKAQLCEE
jgi:hypothetical protein